MTAKQVTKGGGSDRKKRKTYLIITVGTTPSLLLDSDIRSPSSGRGIVGSTGVGMARAGSAGIVLIGGRSVFDLWLRFGLYGCWVVVIVVVVDASMPGELIGTRETFLATGV